MRVDRGPARSGVGCSEIAASAATGLERELQEAGAVPAAIGPLVQEREAVDPNPLAGEGETWASKPRLLGPRPQRLPLWKRILGRG